MQGLVSIITPVFNAQKYIEATIDAVLNQTYQHWEMIMIDDASSDDSVQVIEAIIQNNQKFTLLKLTKNQGSAAARNLGILAAKGDYLTFIDADDLWLPHFIETAVSTIEQTKIPFVFASYFRKDENLNPLLSDFIVPKTVTYLDILKTNSISCLTAFIDLKKLGKKQMPNVRKRQDMGLWLQYLKEIPYAYGIQEPLAIYRIRQESLSRNKLGLLSSQWNYYYNIEKLGFFGSVYYMTHWMIRGYLKYKN